MADASNVVRLRTDERAPSSKRETIDGMNLSTPSTYMTNTSKEETVLEYVEDFRRQFVQVFPDRRPLLLCPENECGIRKFVCTTVKPVALPFDDIYQLENTAKFVADFLTYLPLDNATQLPDLLPSLQTTCQARQGDTLDFAMLLCSLLRGNKYNAYVVSGYAPKWITEQDLSEVDCPLLSKPVDDAAAAAADIKSATATNTASTTPEPEPETSAATAAAEEAQEVKKSKYAIVQRPNLKSKYLQWIEDEAKAKEQKKVTDRQKQSSYVREKPTDPLAGDRVHCWVLVMAGRRGVKEHVFVEPTTGMVYPVSKCPYNGIESLWNEKNYWANVQTVPVNDMVYSLDQTELWEYLLIDEQQFQAKDALNGGFESVGVDGGMESANVDDLFDDRDILDAPMSWCEVVNIEREEYRARYPGGYKKVLYRGAKVEYWSDYNEEVECCVLKITKYATQDCITPIEIRREYRYRRDKLTAVVEYPLENRTHSFFAPGRPGCLKEFIVVNSEETIDGPAQAQERTFIFYKGARVLGMIRREETVGVKSTEYYENRDDFLIYRSIAVEANNNHDNNPTGRHKGYRVALAGCTEKPLRKITEKYARNSAKNAEEDIRKRTHFISEGTIRLNYHYGEHFISASHQVIDKVDKDKTEVDLVDDVDDQENAIVSKTHQVRVNSKWKAPSRAEQKEFVSKLWQIEKEVLGDIRDREEHVEVMLKNLGQLPKNDVLQDERMQFGEKDIYDAAYEESKLNQTKEKGKEEKTEKEEVDYLSPFLAQYPPDRKLRPEQALAAKESCLAALKERLLERASIIQAHLDQENTKLRSRQAVYKRQAGSGQPEADEEFTRYYEEAAFRIEILRSRLIKHEEEAVAQYFKMDERLSADHRLAVLKEVKLSSRGGYD